jgi:hypothetical protein
MTTKQFFTILAAVSCITIFACGQSNDKQNHSVNSSVGIQDAHQMDWEIIRTDCDFWKLSSARVL